MLARTTTLNTALWALLAAASLGLGPAAHATDTLIDWTVTGNVGGTFTYDATTRTFTDYNLTINPFYGEPTGYFFGVYSPGWTLTPAQVSAGGGDPARYPGGGYNPYLGGYVLNLRPYGLGETETAFLSVTDSLGVAGTTTYYGQAAVNSGWAGFAYDGLSGTLSGVAESTGITPSGGAQIPGGGAGPQGGGSGSTVPEPALLGLLGLGLVGLTRAGARR